MELRESRIASITHSPKHVKSVNFSNPSPMLIGRTFCQIDFYRVLEDLRGRDSLLSTSQRVALPTFQGGSAERWPAWGEVRPPRCRWGCDWADWGFGDLVDGFLAGWISPVEGFAGRAQCSADSGLHWI